MLSAIICQKPRLQEGEMRSVFLSHSFQDEDRELVANVDRLLASHGIRTLTGRRLGGQLLAPEIERRIRDANGLIALMTRRDGLPNGGWTTHAWVQDEIGIARACNRHCVAVVESGVAPPGATAGHEWIPFDRSSPLAALLSLSETIAIWKQAVGRTVKVQILPENLARGIGQGNGNFECRYRLMREGQFCEWITVKPVLEPGGTFVYVAGVNDDHAIQLSVQAAERHWLSPARSQWMVIQLEAQRRGR